MVPTLLLGSLAHLLDAVALELGDLDARGLRRRLTTIQAVDGPRVQLDGRWVTSWCSNDYLGLSQHPRLIAAAAEAAARWGIGARASRLLGGSTDVHAQLELALAHWHGAQAALVFSSGYLANAGALGVLLSAEDLVLVDRLAHASLLDAVRATRARLRVFRHNDVEHVRRLLAAGSGGRRRVIVTEGVFSMDGDPAPLEALCGVAEQHDALVYLDDAHGAFILGARGRGSAEGLVASGCLLYMGTLGKALGCQGGFVAGPRAWIDLLTTRARTFIYATALAVPVAAAAVAALAMLDEDPSPVARLRARAGQLAAGLMSLAGQHPDVGFPGAGLPAAPNGKSTGAAQAGRPGHLVPVVVGEAQDAVRVADRLLASGHWAPAIRPPTVPRGTARLRLSVTAGHTEADIQSLVDALDQALKS